MSNQKLKAFIRKDMRKLSQERELQKNPKYKDDFMEVYLGARYHTLKEILGKLK